MQFRTGIEKFIYNLLGTINAWPYFNLLGQNFDNVDNCIAFRRLAFPKGNLQFCRSRIFCLIFCSCCRILGETSYKWVDLEMEHIVCLQFLLLQVSLGRLPTSKFNSHLDVFICKDFQIVDKSDTGVNYPSSDFLSQMRSHMAKVFPQKLKHSQMLFGILIETLSINF